ncbi:MAG TPA: DnaA/Hda family protein, partial [Candidatus Saccharimonadales bacterium]
MDDRLWQSVLGEIELSVSRASFATWFKNTELLDNKDGELRVGVPNIFAKQQLESKFSDLIEQTVVKNGTEVKSINFVIGTSSGTANNKLKQNPTSSQLSMERPAVVTKTAVAATPASGMNNRYTFASFIVGSSNELAYAACQAIVQNPGIKYNPLFVYGGVGLGKTHLIQAV